MQYGLNTGLEVMESQRAFLNAVLFVSSSSSNCNRTPPKNRVGVKTKCKMPTSASDKQSMMRTPKRWEQQELRALEAAREWKSKKAGKTKQAATMPTPFVQKRL